MKIISTQLARRLGVDHVDLGGGKAAVGGCVKLPPWWSPRAWAGLGDVLAAVFKATGIAAAAKGVERLTGKPCGCAQRQAALNRALPL